MKNLGKGATRPRTPVRIYPRPRPADPMQSGYFTRMRSPRQHTTHKTGLFYAPAGKNHAFPIMPRKDQIKPLKTQREECTRGNADQGQPLPPYIIIYIIHNTATIIIYTHIHTYIISYIYSYTKPHIKHIIYYISVLYIITPCKGVYSVYMVYYTPYKIKRPERP